VQTNEADVPNKETVRKNKKLVDEQEQGENIALRTTRAVAAAAAAAVGAAARAAGAAGGAADAASGGGEALAP
ncbi:hypothetical protein HK097_001624, partial [Rhizophlyctis rosea]